jgi:hypothetical protein
MVVSFKRRPQKLGVWNQSLAKQFPNVSFSSWTSPVKTSTASSFVPDGKEILYLEQNQIWSVSIEPAGANLHVGAPQGSVHCPSTSPHDWNGSVSGFARWLAHLLSTRSQAPGRFQCDSDPIGLDEKMSFPIGESELASEDVSWRVVQK